VFAKALALKSLLVLNSEIYGECFMKRIAALLFCISLTSVASAKPFRIFDTKLKDTALGMNETSDISKIQLVSCKPVGGTSVTVLAQVGYLTQVKIVSGNCQGLNGWVSTANLVKAGPAD
jgi:hypothetical protein